jgi:hypothetical protein
LKSAIEDLFGSDAWYALKESNHIPTWRRYGAKTLQAVGVAIAATVDVADDDWRQEIDKLLADGIRRIKEDAEIDEIIATLAGTLIRISFAQIGLMPRRKGTAKSSTLRKDAWRLDLFRSVIYTQTTEQKERVFWSNQQREIGFDAQLELHAKYRQSKSNVPYSEWCKNAKKA